MFFSSIELFVSVSLKALFTLKIISSMELSAAAVIASKFAGDLLYADIPIDLDSEPDLDLEDSSHCSQYTQLLAAVGIATCVRDQHIRQSGYLLVNFFNIVGNCCPSFS